MRPLSNGLLFWLIDGGDDPKHEISAPLSLTAMLISKNKCHDSGQFIINPQLEAKAKNPLGRIPFADLRLGSV